jgi:hypothetical protein
MIIDKHSIRIGSIKITCNDSINPIIEHRVYFTAYQNGVNIKADLDITNILQVFIDESVLPTIKANLDK